MAPTHYDVIIIGAGMSGLAAAIRLAYFERKVLVLERHYAAGGLNSYYALGGYQFDVGLHAMTNYVPPGTRGAPLTKICRQLRLKPEDFALVPQYQSEIRFPGITLRFTNDFECFIQEVVEHFPAEKDNFLRLVRCIRDYDELDLEAKPISGRQVVSSYLTDPLLIDMLFCPLMIYGNAAERDMEFGQFVVMFKSIFCEGLARPREGVRRIINVLRRKVREVGGTVRMKCGVKAFHYEVPQDLVDPRSGVICCPDNFLYDKPLPKSMIRMTCLANFDGWSGLPEAEYVAAKAEWLPRIHREVLQFVPDFRDRIVFTDFFTPRSIKQWTGHLNGAVYGMPGKIKTGRTHLENLFICGNDQGFLGIVGAMLSGISMANLHILKK